MKKTEVVTAPNGQQVTLEKDGLWTEVKRYRAQYLMLAPYALLFIFFTVLPVLSSIVLSFTYFNMLQMPRFVGWSNYITLFLDDEIFLIAVKNTLVFAFITGPICYMACWFFAWFINELNPKLRAFMTFVFYAPSISGNLYFIWQFIFSGDSYGLVNSTLMRFGLLDEPILWLTDTKYMLTIIILIQIWLSLGAGFLSFIAGLQGVDKSMYEAGAIDGIRNRWQELWYITLPAMGPMLMFAAVMQIASSFSVADVAIQLCGNPSTDYAAHTVVTHIMDYGNTRFEMGYASAIAVVLFAVMILTKILITKVLTKFTDVN